MNEIERLTVRQAGREWTDDVLVVKAADYDKMEVYRDGQYEMKVLARQQRDKVTLLLAKAEAAITTMASDRLLLSERTLELEGQREDLALQIEDLLEELIHTKEEHESTSRLAATFEDRMGELQSENGKLKDRMGTLQSVPEGKALVDFDALRDLLKALVNEPHRIRELQAT